MYDVSPTSTGGITKNHFIAVSSMSGNPFGVCHRCATTSRIEYREAVKIPPKRNATQNVERKGDLPGRASHPPPMKGRTSRQITRLPPSRAPQNAALKSAIIGVPAPHTNQT